MKKILKVFFIMIFALLVFSFSSNVKANSISKISMDIFIDNNGNANVTETWNCNTNKGTEVYHPYYNLGSSEIKNLSVSDGSKQYTSLSSWNTSGTLSSKAYKCGINRISNGVELCWGISNYGNHTYTVKYTITNFVAELTDSQMVYWTLIPYEFSNSIGSVYIKIHTGFNIPDNVDVWGYGNYGGTAYVYNGYIEMQSDGRLDTDEYMTILVKFPKGSFETTNVLDYNFNHYYNMAQEGATAYSKPSNGYSILVGIFGFLLNILPFIIVVFASIYGSKKNSSTLDFGKEGKNIPKDVAYFRDIPCWKDLFRAYYIGYSYGIIKNKTDILGAFILKWLKESRIRIEQRDNSSIFKKEETVIILNETDPDSIVDDKERSLFKMLYTASEDGILENKEFERWCRKSYSKILDWFDSILDREKTKLVNCGLITVQDASFLKVFKYKKYCVTDKMRNEALELAGLKRFLEDYSLIPEREAIEVDLFEEYLIYAQMMGIAKKVAKQFKDLYPEIIEQSCYNSYDYIIFINTSSHHGVAAAQTAKSRAESYSSGGGGFSSGGGGGGSFGGGGGRRWIPLKFRIIFLLYNKKTVSSWIRFFLLFIINSFKIDYILL